MPAILIAKLCWLISGSGSGATAACTSSFLFFFGGTPSASVTISGKELSLSSPSDGAYADGGLNFRLPLELTATEDLWLDSEVSLDEEWNVDLELEGPARGVAVALERVRDLVTTVLEEAAEPPLAVAAKERDMADPRDFLEIVDAPFAATHSSNLLNVGKCR
jgi:hypothetical protein